MSAAGPSDPPAPITNQVAGRSPGGPGFPPPSNRPISWERWAPEVRLLDAPRIACSPLIFGLAFAGLLVAAAGDRLIGLLDPPAPVTRGGEVVQIVPSSTVPVPWPWEAPGEAPALTPLPPTGALPAWTREPLLRTLAPLRPAWDGLATALDPQPQPNGARFWVGCLRLLWGLAAWGFFGTAICRRAAVRFAVRSAVYPAGEVKLAASRWISALGAPLLPAAGLASLAIGLALLGWAGEIPAAGPWIVALLWGPALLAGAAAVVLCVVGAAGWPLMLAALATENADALDAFSRAFSYVLGRPVRVLMHAALAVLLAVASVWLATWAAEAAALFAVGFAQGGGSLSETGLSLHDTAPEGDPPAARVSAVWLALWLRGLPAAYAAGLFWTSATASYFLLRFADDAVETDEVWLPGDPPPPPVENEEDDPPASDDETVDEVPRVGVAASPLPRIERDHRPTVD